MSSRFKIGGETTSYGTTVQFFFSSISILLFLLLGRSTMMKKTPSCAMLVDSANMPALTLCCTRSRAVPWIPLRMRKTGKRLAVYTYSLFTPFQSCKLCYEYANWLSAQTSTAFSKRSQCDRSELNFNLAAVANCTLFPAGGDQHQYAAGQS